MVGHSESRALSQHNSRQSATPSSLDNVGRGAVWVFTTGRSSADTAEVIGAAGELLVVAVHNYLAPS